MSSCTGGRWGRGGMLVACGEAEELTVKVKGRGRETSEGEEERGGAEEETGVGGRGGLTCRSPYACSSWRRKRRKMLEYLPHSHSRS
eukprot:768333-Hanusia_phi.AAC.1